MEALIEETASASVEPSPILQEIQALNSNQSSFVNPPYDGGYLRRNFTPGPNAVFDSADRQYTQRGDIVAQLWNQRSANAFGLIESGLRKRFKARATGRHHVLVRVDAGPITRLHGAGTFARSFIPGVGGNYGSVASHQTSYVSYIADLTKGKRYTLFVMGGVTIVTRPGLPRAYGEVIATFPHTTIFPAALNRVSDPFDDQLRQALESHDSPEEAAAALSADMEDGMIELN